MFEINSTWQGLKYIKDTPRLIESVITHALAKYSFTRCHAMAEMNFPCFILIATLVILTFIDLQILPSYLRLCHNKNIWLD